jgi:hypothetical protein
MEVMRERQFAKSSQRTDGLISGVWRAINFLLFEKNANPQNKYRMQHSIML